MREKERQHAKRLKERRRLSDKRLYKLNEGTRDIVT